MTTPATNADVQVVIDENLAGSKGEVHRAINVVMFGVRAVLLVASTHFDAFDRLLGVVNSDCL